MTAAEASAAGTIAAAAAEAVPQAAVADAVASDAVVSGAVVPSAVVSSSGAPGSDPAVADRVWDAMRDLVHDYERRREVSEALGMSIAKIKALRRLAARPMTGKELAVELMTDAPRASVLIDELVQRGLAVRNVHPDDRRVRIVGVTELGAAEADRATKILCRAPDSLRRLPPADLDELDRILRRFAAPRA